MAPLLDGPHVAIPPAMLWSSNCESSLHEQRAHAGEAACAAPAAAAAADPCSQVEFYCNCWKVHQAHAVYLVMWLTAYSGFTLVGHFTLGMSCAKNVCSGFAPFGGWPYFFFGATSFGLILWLSALLGFAAFVWGVATQVHKDPSRCVWIPAVNPCCSSLCGNAEMLLWTSSRRAIARRCAVQRPGAVPGFAPCHWPVRCWRPRCRRTGDGRLQFGRRSAIVERNAMNESIVRSESPCLDLINRLEAHAPLSSLDGSPALLP